MVTGEQPEIIKESDQLISTPELQWRGADLNQPAPTSEQQVSVTDPSQPVLIPEQQENVIDSSQPIQVREQQESVTNPSQRVFKSLADFCNRLPFSGKLAITPIVTDAIKERNPYYKTVKTIEAAGLLGVMALAHASQAAIGVYYFQQNLEHFSRIQAPETLLACGIDVAFTVANCAATYAQLYLGGRLMEHFKKTNAKAVPRLAAWGINGEDVDYDKVAERLMTAVVNNNQSDIDTFFMILPKEKKQQVMESIRAITQIVDETYSNKEISQKIGLLEKDIEKKSRFRYVFDITKNAHKNSNGTQPYSFKEQMKMLIISVGGNVGFLGFG